MTDTTCPCCGAAVQRKLPLVDLDTNTCSFAGERVGLTPREAELAYTLVQRFPAVVSYDSLIRTVWGSTEPESVASVLKTMKCRLCRKMRKIGFNIRVVYTRGYALERIAS